MDKRKLPSLLHNLTSAVGFVLAVVTSLIILFLLGINFIVGIKSPYIGILLYMLLPSFLVLGLLLIPSGMYLRWRQLRKGGELTFKWPHIDLNDKHHMRAAIIFLLGTALFILLSSVGIYQAYQFTESVAFCGKLCHVVMKPEYIAYQQSPHARVECVACHIGSGVGWYAKSKLSGLYQVYAVLANAYPRPIPTPISKLRPASETCEQCHWPKIFYGGMQRRFDHYLYDKNNSKWPINMLLKVGSGRSLAAPKSGIHWHVNPDIKVEYIATDNPRQNITWVRVSDKLTGKVTVFHDTSAPQANNPIASQLPRVMDCMDCHNRPSHDMHSPDYAIDLEISSGGIASSIPEIKQTAVTAMTNNYVSDTDAMSGIAVAINGFYRTNYPQLYSERSTEINNAVKATQKAFQQNIFPAMKARWSYYPNNIGHFIFRGCMRCHDGKHKSDEGLIIPNNCRTCHIILEQGNSGPKETLNMETGQAFRHPVDIGNEWQSMGCYECHGGIHP
ncbi:MAG: NapC/NirT family cytochrome c [Dissulfurispiraceae bacterium]